MAARKLNTGLAKIDGLSVDEIENLVVKLGREGISSSKIGLIMRDQYAVPNVKEATGMNVKKILDSHKVKRALPDSLVSVILNAVKIYEHLNRNPRDFRTKRSLEMVEARINKLAVYYKRDGILPVNWRYNRERAAFLIRK